MACQQEQLCLPAITAVPPPSFLGPLRPADSASILAPGQPFRLCLPAITAVFASSSSCAHHFGTVVGPLRMMVGTYHLITPGLSNLYRSYAARRTMVHARHAARSPPMWRAPPRGTLRTHSTPSRNDGVEHRYLPRSALRASLGRLKRSPGGQQAEAYGAKGSLAGSGARTFKCLRRTRSRAGIGTSLRAQRVARTPQTQPGVRH